MPLKIEKTPRNRMQVPMDQLDAYDNETQLSLLLKEIKVILVQPYSPPQEWFSVRIQKIKEYAELNWEDLSYRFKDRDPYLYHASAHIMALLVIVQQEWASTQRFRLSHYGEVIDLMDDLWTYYKTNYDQEEEQLIDLMENCRT